MNEIAPAPIAPALVAHDIARHYPVRRGLFSRSAILKAVDGVSFEVPAGATLAVVAIGGGGPDFAKHLVLTGSVEARAQTHADHTTAQRDHLAAAIGHANLQRRRIADECQLGAIEVRGVDLSRPLAEVIRAVRQPARVEPLLVEIENLGQIGTSKKLDVAPLRVELPTGALGRLTGE